MAAAGRPAAATPNIVIWHCGSASSSFTELLLQFYFKQIINNAGARQQRYDDD